ncbi:MucB/RseB C-terminal domain-containing protein [Thioflavicoccus mobilis]|uniref:MucB/RseB C-terminal domain-containing protein n=1 Tax=Thioflavicoccus mobilis TaxID=80679 RepID=UPI000313A694|nr:MucB/RseB C-terminal domain-containing protein [Thioflavicoccus mobilis]
MCALAVLWGGCGWAVAAPASPPPFSAAEQLQRMAIAANTLSFEGTLVYLHRNRAETLFLHHRVEGGRVNERLVSMTGPVRTVTREEGEVTCTLPNSHPISVKRHGVAQDLLRSEPLDARRLAGHYRIVSLGVARVAGRTTDALGIIPRDAFRYGYRFYLDRETGLPLKTDLMGTDAEPLEQVMFTSIELTGPTSAAPTVAKAAAEETTATHQPGESRWHFEQLPEGFELLMHQDGDDELQPVEHFLLSDGLAAVSVYVEPDSGAGLEGETRIGAIHAIGGLVAEHRVTAVGEVPAATVAAVLAGIRFDGRGATQ